MNYKSIVPIIALVAVAAVLAFMWMGSVNKNKELVQEKKDLQEAFEIASQTIGEIQSSMDALDQDLSGQLFTSKELPGTTPEERKKNLINSISNMRKQIESDKQKIQDLEKKLAQSGAQLRGVQDLLEKLKASVADKERIVSELQSQLGIAAETLETERRKSAEELAVKEKVIGDKNQTIEEQKRDMNTIYYIFGSRKELMEKKIIDRKGGLLGIGKVSTVSSQINVEAFSSMNLLDSQRITFPAPKKGYAVLTNQNAASYNISKDGDKNVLTVTDPTTFRKQKFVVIELL